MKVRVLLGSNVRRRAIRAKRVIALEGLGADVVDVDVIARLDVLAGEADDLAVLIDRFAFLDRLQRELVPQANASSDRQFLAVKVQHGAGLKRLGDDGQVILRTQMNGHVGQRHGGHERFSKAK